MRPVFYRSTLTSMAVCCTIRISRLLILSFTAQPEATPSTSIKKGRALDARPADALTKIPPPLFAYRNLFMTLSRSIIQAPDC